MLTILKRNLTIFGRLNVCIPFNTEVPYLVYYQKIPPHCLIDPLGTAGHLFNECIHSGRELGLVDTFIFRVRNEFNTVDRIILNVM